MLKGRFPSRGPAHIFPSNVDRATAIISQALTSGMNPLGRHNGASVRHNGREKIEPVCPPHTLRPVHSCLRQSLQPGFVNIPNNIFDVMDGIVHAGIHHGQADDLRQNEQRVEIAFRDIPLVMVV